MFEPASFVCTESGRQLPGDWPNWRFDLAALAGPMARVEGVVEKEPPLIKAGLGHLWFVTLHPFDDGSPQRFYSLSAQIQRERKAYYDILEQTQKRSLDVTEWLAWFLDTLHCAVDQAQHALDAVLTTTRFWQRWATTPLNERQVKLLNKLLDGFEGKLTSSKWAAIAKCSPDSGRAQHKLWAE